MIPQSHYWNTPREQLFDYLKSSPAGLSQDQALEKLQIHGANVLKAPTKHLARQVAERFFNPLIIILLLASGISAFSGEITGFVIILLIIILSTVLDFMQQYRAEKAAEKLRDSVAVKASVLRDGKVLEVFAANIVPGDIVVLGAGDLVPADGIVLEEKDIFINQSLLTGESYPVEKKAELTESVEELSRAVNAVFLGTSVVSGTAKMLVCRTGHETFMGDIGETLGQTPPPTAFDEGVRKFGFLIMRLTVGLVLFVILINTIFNRPLMESFLFAIAVAVGLTPELLPAIMTVTLSRGALRMSKKSVIVKRLNSIQNLGAMDVLCSDKTGTLTEGKIILEKHINTQGQDSAAVLKWAYLNSYFETGYKSPIDQAILEHAEISTKSWKKIDEVPFDFERRRVSVLVDNGEQRYLVVKGAPEEILNLSNFQGEENTAKIDSLNDQDHERILNSCHELENEGFRSIGIAWKEVGRDIQHAHVSDEMQLVFAGLAAFHDPPKSDIKGVLKSISESHIAFSVVTGDSERVARHLFKQVGLEIKGVLTGADIQQLDDASLEATVAQINLFCRVSPSQKNRIILAYKKRGHVVGYLGDGANDAPSLHSADVGISVEEAVDVAKEAADIVLLKHDLKTLLAGIFEGRRTHVNIMKYIMMATSSNFGNMFSMAGASLLLPFLPMLPLQVLLNNFLYDISEMTIPMDRVDIQSLKHPTQWDIQFVHRFMWIIGLLSSIFDFVTFYILIKIFQADEVLFHTGWFVESMATQVLVIFIIRTRLNPFKSKPSLALIATSMGVVLIAALLPFSSVAKSLGFVPLNHQFYFILGLILVCYLGMVEIVKRWFYRRWMPLKTIGH